MAKENGNHRKANVIATYLDVSAVRRFCPAFNIDGFTHPFRTGSSKAWRSSNAVVKPVTPTRPNTDKVLPAFPTMHASDCFSSSGPTPKVF